MDRFESSVDDLSVLIVGDPEPSTQHISPVTIFDETKVLLDAVVLGRIGGIKDAALLVTIHYILHDMAIVSPKVVSEYADPLLPINFKEVLHKISDIRLQY